MTGAKRGRVGGLCKVPRRARALHHLECLVREQLLAIDDGLAPPECEQMLRGAERGLRDAIRRTHGRLLHGIGHAAGGYWERAGKKEGGHE